MTQPVYKVGKNCKHRNRPCAKCGGLLKLGRKYVLIAGQWGSDGLPQIYHAGCWQQMRKL